ncbi:MCE family protein [Mycolicibacterium fluoranthenivorans]|uniref:MCE family protein n=1 Tax=Mycolicibacterium fluoranthenivorans TaxID=258505 RepID=A0A7G8PNE3_9MYCO|nr:MCE family protein [Mycolicibacterium fluoranthenivorans]QNJ95859.1 MCE family protein [Mycolicibacterium fluoranthenivorans]
MKTFSERNPVQIGVIGTAIIVVLVAFALLFDKIPFLSSDETYSAYFADAGALQTGSKVQVSGYRVGVVSRVTLDGDRVRVDFTVADNIKLGDRTEAAIKVDSLLGTRIIDVRPRGDNPLKGPITLDRTTSPYQLPDALNDLTRTIGALDTDQLSDSLLMLSQTFKDTPPELRDAVAGVSRLASTISGRDVQLRNLLTSANKVTGVLRARTDQVVGLIRDANALLAQLQTQGAALDQIAGNISAVSKQLGGLINEHRTTLKPALDKLNSVLTIVDNRRDKVAQSLKLLNAYAMSLGESVSSGPFFNAYVANLLPGQYVQPFIDAAFSDLGLDPNVLAPSQLIDPQVGQRATPALPSPFPRTGQDGPPNLTLPDAITGNPGDPGCGPPGLPLPGPTGCYPYRAPLPAPPPGGPPPGPPAPPVIPGAGATDASPAGPVDIPAPGEISTGGAGPAPGPAPSSPQESGGQ